MDAAGLGTSLRGAVASDAEGVFPGALLADVDNASISLQSTQGVTFFAAEPLNFLGDFYDDDASRSGLVFATARGVS